MKQVGSERERASGMTARSRSQKTTSERRKLEMSRALKWCRLIYILLLVQSVPQLREQQLQRPQLVAATSQISSVWVERDEHDKESGWLKEATSKLRQKISQNSTSNGAEKGRAQGGEKLLAVAASSLHPQVADIPRNWPLTQQVAQRRSSQPVPVATPQFKLAHIGEETNSLGELLQDNDRERRPTQAGRSNQTSNLGVHFDEDPNLEQNSRNRNSVPKPVVGDFDAIDRRQDNETTLSSFDPKQAEFQPDGGINYDEPQQFRTNRSRFETPDDHNQTDTRRNPPRGSDPVAGIYYSPEADTWNLSLPDEGDSEQQQQRRRRRPSSRRGVARVQVPSGGLEGAAQDQEDEMYFVNYTTASSLPPPTDSTWAAHRIHEQAGPVEQVAQTRPPPPMRTPDHLNRWSAPVASLLPDSQDLTSFKYDSEPHRARATFRPQPANFQQPQQSWKTPAGNTLGPPRPQQAAPPAAVNYVAPIYSTLRVAPPQASLLPHTLHQLLAAGQSNELIGQPIRRTKPARQQIVQLGETASQSSAGKSFLRSYNPIQLLGHKTRKSLLGNINEKLNYWMGDSANTNSRDEMRLLESAFFDQRYQLERPKLSANFRPVRPLHPLERPHYLGAIRQPTVAPVSMARFQGHAQQPTRLNRPHRATPARPNRMAQQQASFIPVVAVQVTRTSPAPITAQEASNSLLPYGNSAEASGQSVSSSSNEIDRYLAAKLSRQPTRNQFDANERQKWDDSSSSAGVSYPDSYHGKRQATRHHHHQHQIPLASQHHETTVKGAVFGYLPHQADAPLMQAMNVLQQLPPHSQLAALAADSSRLESPLDFYSGSNAAGSNELYANQMDKSSQSVEAATSLLDFQQPGRLQQLGDEQANLALQLQASNFAQNDLAHPFGFQAVNLGGGENPHYGKAPVRRRTPLSTQHQQTQYQFGPPLQLLGSHQLQAIAGQQDQLGQLVASQLAPVQSNSVEPYYALLQTGSSSPGLQQPLANELNPLMFSTAHQPQDSFYNAPREGQLRRPQPEDGSGSAAPDSAELGHSDSAGGGGAQSSEPILQESQRNQALNTKGRKRSGEFFANAGQLLLSALPLLLAPTLGLMFAAAPSIPAARYHGQLASASGHTNLFGGGGSSELPHDPAGQPEDGLVLNASPVPQLFTPSPPGSHHLQSDEQLDVLSSQSQPVNERPRGRKSTQTTTTTTTTSTTTVKPRGQFKSSASLPALTGIDLGANSSSSRKLDTGQAAAAATRRPLPAVILTTLGPGVKLIANGSELEQSTGSGGNKSLELAESGAGGDTTLITPTLLLIETQPEDQQPVASGPSQEQDSDSRAEEPARRADNATQSGPARNSFLYDVGYQGADFDAQFPSLRKPAASTKLRLASSAAPLDKLVRNKSQYQYDHLEAADESGAQTEKAANSDPEKLYPVSTWPALRRRTVSLITSNGNKTVLEAAPRRAAPSTMVAINNLDARLESNSNRTEATSNRRKLNNLDSFLVESDENRSARVSERRKAVPQPIRRKREAPDETVRVNLSDRRASNSTGAPVAKRVTVIKRRKLASGQGGLWRNNSQQPNAGDRAEQLDGDASRRKAAIVTAMITQVGGEKASDQELELDRRRPPDGASDEQDDELDDESELAQELHEQLAKKLALDHVATRMAAAATAGSNESETADEELEGLRSGGRGRFKPVQVADFPLNHTVASSMQERQNGSSSWRSPRERAMKTNSIELNDKTERALAKFSSLWLEDTLQANPAAYDGASDRGEQHHHDHDRRRHRRRRQRRGDVTKRSKQWPDRASGELQEGSATERSYSPARATTQTPLISAEQLQENWSHYYNTDRNSTRDGRQHEQPSQPLVYRNPQSRARARNNNHHHHLHEEAGDRFELARPHRGAQQEAGGGQLASGNLSSSAIEFGQGGQAVAFKQTRPTGGASPRVEPSGDQRNGSAYESPDRDLLDARHSSYLNYSTSAPAYYQHDYYPPLGPARPHDSHPHSAPPPSYYPDDHYRQQQQPPPPQQQQHYQMSSYGPNEPPAPYGHDNRRVRQPPARAWEYPADSRRPDEFASHARSYSPSSPPPARHPYEQQHQTPSGYPPHLYSNSHLQYQPPVSSTYAPAPSSLAPHQTFAGPLQVPTPFAGHRLNAAASRSSAPEAVNSRSIGDYLKRAQFSDSDRDKLMASYLTCDGLLHDNDHCLERLSCEFSDPKNIETANKLDRAVSSILLGHILINGFIPSSFKLRLKSASMYGYTHSGKCSRFACSKLARQNSASSQETQQNLHDDETQQNHINNDRRR